MSCFSPKGLKMQALKYVSNVAHQLCLRKEREVRKTASFLKTRLTSLPCKDG